MKLPRWFWWLTLGLTAFWITLVLIERFGEIAAAVILGVCLAALIYAGYRARQSGDDDDRDY